MIVFGGVVSDGNDIKIFGFNLSKNQMKFKLNKALALDEETALIASLAAVMDIGLDRDKIEPRIRNKDDGVPQNG